MVLIRAVAADFQTVFITLHPWTILWLYDGDHAQHKGNGCFQVYHYAKVNEVKKRNPVLPLNHET